MMKSLLKRLLKTEDGLETVEYAILAGLLVVGIVITLSNLGQALLVKLGALLTALTG